MIYGSVWVSFIMGYGVCGFRYGMGKADPQVTHDKPYWHLLHWIESMSILHRSQDTVQLLEWLEAWICISQFLVTISCMLKFILLGLWFEKSCSPALVWHIVTQHFVQVFASDIKDHPLLVYATALPFTPANTTIYQAFCPSINQISVIVIVGMQPL